MTETTPIIVLLAVNAPPLTCGHCPAFVTIPIKDTDTIQHGQCRAALPELLVHPNGEFHTIFPTMPCDEWCMPGRDKMSGVKAAVVARPVKGYDEL